MTAKATNLALSEELVDLNEASANQLQSLLPGIGNVLASRIVAYREEHGPFENPTDITKVDGIGEKLFSKLAPRLSVAPSSPYSGYSIRSEAPAKSGTDTFATQLGGPDTFAPRAETKDENAFPSVLSIEPHYALGADRSSISDDKEEVDFFESGDALRSPGAPDLESLLLRGKVNHTVPSEAATTVHESLRIQEPMPGASLRIEEPLAVQEIETANGEVIPLSRPWRAWGIAAGIALFSAAIGSIYGIRSQEGGPRAGLERQVVRTQDQVADLKGSVKALEEQSSSFASSINALDARISTQEDGRATPPKRQARPTVNEARGPSAGPSKKTEVRDNVRQALRTLDGYLDEQPAARAAR